MSLHLVREDGAPAAPLSRGPPIRHDDSQRRLFPGWWEEDALTVVVGRFEPVVAFGLAHVLRDSSLRVLAKGLEGETLERVMASRTPQVAILGAPAEPRILEHLRSSWPATGLLVLAHQPTRAYGVAVLAAGATCISRNASPVEILAAIDLVAQGGRVFVSADGERVERGLPSLPRLLTPRELDVLELLSQGRASPQIASALKIDLATVRAHSARIHQKLNICSDRELVGMPVPRRSVRPRRLRGSVHGRLR